MAAIAIVGTGGMGREAHAWAVDCGLAAELVGYLDEEPSRRGEHIHGLPVLGGLGWLDGAPQAKAIVAVGAPAGRARVLDELSGRGTDLVTLVHPTAVIGPGVDIGDGSLVCPGVVLTTDITIGRATIVNYGAIAGHDCRIGDAVFIAPGAHLAGNVTLEDRADIGIGASIVQGVRIGAGARVGAGAVVIQDVEPGITVVGVPARPIGTVPAAQGRDDT